LKIITGDFSDVQLGFPGLVYQDRPMPAFRVVAKTAQCPLLRFEHESTLYRIAMHVRQFFDPPLFHYAPYHTHGTSRKPVRSQYSA